LNHAARAEELAQETFFIIIRGAEQYEARAKFRTYVFSIAVKQLWSERRKEMRESRASSEPLKRATRPTLLRVFGSKMRSLEWIQTTGRF
jgi:DNA-directed RNA polymerase specialized sigma24 family protein